MTEQKLPYLSQAVTRELYDSVLNNSDRYLGAGFADLAEQSGWEISLSTVFDISPLQNLVTDNNSEAQIENSLLVWEALGELQPSIATEDRLWTRLAHVECFEFAKKRWLSKFSPASLLLSKKKKEAFAKTVRTHFFARGRGGYRDDNAVSRLWWNGFIASLINPDDIRYGLETIIGKADIRLSLIERSRTGSRVPLLRGIARAFEVEPWLGQTEKNFRDFMKELNKSFGGVLLEVLPEEVIDTMLGDCMSRAKAAS